MQGTNDVSHSHNMMQDWFDWSGLTWKSQGLLLTIIALIKDLTLFSSSEFKKTLKIFLKTHFFGINSIF